MHAKSSAPRRASRIALATMLLAAALVTASCRDRDRHSGSDGDSETMADSAGTQWLSYGGTPDEQRHSRLTAINRQTVQQLGPIWSYELKTGRGVETTPIIHNGIMYATSAWSVLHAIDARTGQELWVHDPQVDKAVGAKACCDVVNRGVAFHDGKLYLGVIDGRLQAIDAATGNLIWEQVTVDQSKPYTITGAPRIVNGRVLIGNGGAELGVRGYLSAYNAETGDLAWRFFTVPNPNMEPDGAVSDAILAKLANPSWGKTGAWVQDGGGGTVWDSIIHDTANNLVIFGVGNGSPWNPAIRDPNSGGDNLFLSSIVAVDADTGEYRWHFQTTPRDAWDYTATQTLILADLPWGGEGATRRVVMQAPKNGFFYVLDAKTGEYLAGDAFVPQSWASGLDPQGRPIETTDARYVNAMQLTSPGPLGAHNWQPMAFSPDEGLAFIPAQEIPQAMVTDPLHNFRPTKWNTGADLSAGLPVDPLPAADMKALRATLKGRLIAWDPVARKPRWTVEHDGPWNGGILSTAGGLVFQGTLKGDLVAYDSATGERLWAQNVKSGIAAPAVTYELDGEQYLSIATGWGSAFALAAGFGMPDTVPPALGRIVTFKLGGTATIPEPPMEPIDRKPQTARFGGAEVLRIGQVQYARNCSVCHGPMAISSGVLPDLRWSPLTADVDGWNDVIRRGTRASAGMVSFENQLTSEESEAIRAYVVHQAHGP